MATKDASRGRGNSVVIGDVAERKLKEDSATSAAAEKLLNNATLNKALKAMKQNAFDSLCNTEVNDRDTRESIHFLIKVIDSFKKELATYINKGATANLKLRNK